jgi:hypothetical protein
MITSGDDLDLNEQKAFLATYPSFTTSEVLLAKIIGLVRIGPTTHHHKISCWPFDWRASSQFGRSRRLVND